MSFKELTDRERFRRAGRLVLRRPGGWAAHEVRVMAACRLPGVEPVQGALADLLHACADANRIFWLLRRPEIATRLSSFVMLSFYEHAKRGQHLPCVTPLATRYSVLTMPSLDVPARAVLCGIDDSHEIARTILPLLLAGDEEAEKTFLAHCEGALDTLAFMLVRRALRRHGVVQSDRWHSAASTLEERVQR